MTAWTLAHEPITSAYQCARCSKFLEQDSIQSILINDPFEAGVIFCSDDHAYRWASEQGDTVVEGGLHDDEFPDEHSHIPRQTDDGVHGVYVTDEEGRHYWLQHRLTNEGIFLDLYDRYQEQLIATWAKTWDELGDFVYMNDPMMKAQT